MNEQGVQSFDRYMALSTRDYNGMASNLAGRQTLTGKPLTAYEKAYIGMVASFETYKLDYATRLTAAAGTTVTVNGANQYYTPKAIVSLIVNMLQPFKGRVYDPCMGSGGFFVQSEEFIEQHAGKSTKATGNKASGQISVYGQESNPTTWKLAAMNMAIRGIDFNFGPGHADTLLNDLHPDLRADYVMANPPFNMKEWWNAKLENDPRWIVGTPPQGNANRIPPAEHPSNVRN